MLSSHLEVARGSISRQSTSVSAMVDHGPAMGCSARCRCVSVYSVCEGCCDCLSRCVESLAAGRCKSSSGYARWSGSRTKARPWHVIRSDYSSCGRGILDSRSHRLCQVACVLIASEALGVRVGSLILTVIWYGNTTGPPPTDSRSASIASLFTFSMSVVWAWWIDKPAVRSVQN